MLFRSVRKGQPLCLLHGRSSEGIFRARELLREAYMIGGRAIEPPQRVMEEIGDDDLGED